MNQNSTKNELQNILRGMSQVSHGTLIQTVASYLGESVSKSRAIKDSKSNEDKETKILIAFINIVFYIKPEIFWKNIP